MVIMHMNAYATDTTIIITFDLQAHIIQVHKYCTKCETFQFALPARDLITQENESRAWFQVRWMKSFH